MNFSEYFRASKESPSGLVWSKNIYNGRNRNVLLFSVGEPCGSKHGDGHWSVAFRVNGKQVRKYCHRILWELVNGEIPDGMYIDHINGDRLDNNLSNLRLTTSKGNNSNRAISSVNLSGVTGVSETKSGEYRYVTASWVDEFGKKCNKHFSISKLGYDEAFSLAKEYRELKIQELNKILEYPYSERHGA